MYYNTNGPAVILMTPFNSYGLHVCNCEFSPIIRRSLCYKMESGSLRIGAVHLLRRKANQMYSSTQFVCEFRHLNCLTFDSEAPPIKKLITFYLNWKLICKNRNLILTSRCRCYSSARVKKTNHKTKKNRLDLNESDLEQNRRASRIEKTSHTYTPEFFDLIN